MSELYNFILCALHEDRMRIYVTMQGDMPSIDMHATSCGMQQAYTCAIDRLLAMPT